MTDCDRFKIPMISMPALGQTLKPGDLYNYCNERVLNNKTQMNWFRLYRNLCLFRVENRHLQRVSHIFHPGMIKNWGVEKAIVL